MDILWKRTTSSESSITLWKLSVSIKWNLGIFCSGGNGQHLTAMMCWTWSFFFSFVSFVWVTLIFSLVPHLFSLILTLLLMTASCYHVTYAFQNESTLCSCLYAKELLTRNRRVIWILSDCNGIQTKLAKLATKQVVLASNLVVVS